MPARIATGIGLVADGAIAVVEHPPPCRNGLPDPHAAVEGGLRQLLATLVGSILARSSSSSPSRYRGSPGLSSGARAHHGDLTRRFLGPALLSVPVAASLFGAKAPRSSATSEPTTRCEARGSRWGAGAIEPTSSRPWTRDRSSWTAGRQPKVPPTPINARPGGADHPFRFRTSRTTRVDQARESSQGRPVAVRGDEGFERQCHLSATCGRAGEPSRQRKRCLH